MGKKRREGLPAALVVSVLGLFALALSQPLAATVSIVPLDPRLQRPGGGAIDPGPALDARGRRIVFTSDFRATPQELVLVDNGVASILADDSTVVPRGGASFTAFAAAAILEDGGVAFVALDSGVSGRRIYRWRQGLIELLVGPADLGGTPDVSVLQESAGDLYFIDQESFYRWSGAGVLDRLIAAGDVLPNGATVLSASGGFSGGSLEASDELVALEVRTDLGLALVAWDAVNSVARVVVDQTSNLPGQSRPWSGLPFRTALAVEDSQVTFVDMEPETSRTCSSGIYLWESGSLTQILSRTDRHPTTGVPFECFFAAYRGGGELWFQAATSALVLGGPGRLPTPGELFAVTPRGFVRVVAAFDDRFPDPLHNYAVDLMDGQAVLSLGFFGLTGPPEYRLYTVPFASLVVGVPSLSWVGLLCFVGFLAVLAMKSLRGGAL